MVMVRTDNLVSLEKKRKTMKKAFDLEGHLTVLSILKLIIYFCI